MSTPDILVDLATFTVDGPSFLFIRPRRALSEEEWRNVGSANNAIAEHNPDVLVICVPHDFELLGAGEAELRALGFARVAAASVAP